MPTTSTAGSYYSTDDCWTYWITNSSATTTTSTYTHTTNTSSDTTWISWCGTGDTYQIRNVRQVPTREQQEAMAAEAAERNRRAAAEAEERRKASVRARQLLLENLTPTQRRQFEKNGWFIVEGGRTGRKYRLNSRWAMSVDEIAANDNNRMTGVLCAHTPRHVPLEDNLLAQKLVLECCEDEFLRVANRRAA